MSLFHSASLVLACACACTGAEHPYILWTKDEAAAIRVKIETEPWAKARWQALCNAMQGSGADRRKTGFPPQCATLHNLFRYQVLGDAAAGETEKRALLGLTGASPEGTSRYDNRYWDALRYDALYPALSAAQRTEIEAVFRRWIEFHLQDKFVYARETWLPNMQWPRPMTAHLMALALGDEKLIRAMFESNGGWKYYFDDYVADGYFYCEEFGKQYSVLGAMLLWCRGLERLGLGQLGYGYTGKGGATMQRYVEGLVRLGYPRTAEGLRPAYLRVTMGDARGGPYTQHASVAGYGADGSGGNAYWSAARMNGGVPLMQAPLWFEIVHARWPDAGFDYFLAQMRAPDEERFLPTLFLVDPVDPAQVKPPPAPSYVALERGFALLRAEEGPPYWEGPAPAVGFQFATYYLHYTCDCFSLLGFHAFNRPLYVNPGGLARGYAGGDPWQDSVRGHCGVVVDGLRARTVGPVPTRSGLDGLVKFVAASGRPLRPFVPVPAEETTADFHQKGCLRAWKRSAGPEIYPGVDLERALFLTREYLVDIYRLASDRPRTYDWQVHSPCFVQLEDARWHHTRKLEGTLYDLSDPQNAGPFKDPQEKACYELRDVAQFECGGGPWRVRFLGGSPPGGKEQFGVCASMLGAPDTEVFTGLTPARNPDEKRGSTLLVRRVCPATVFVALHEPFRTPPEQGPLELRRLQETPDAVALAVVRPAGPPCDDRILYRFWKEHAQPLTLSGEGESFIFADRAYVRITAGKVEASGDLRALRVKVPGQARFFLNGQEAPARVQGGLLVWEQ